MVGEAFPRAELVCVLCVDSPAKFKCTASLDMHLKMTHLEDYRPYVCRFCDDRFAIEVFCQAHMMAVHDTWNDDAQVVYHPEPYKEAMCKLLTMFIRTNQSEHGDVQRTLKIISDTYVTDPTSTAASEHRSVVDEDMYDYEENFDEEITTSVGALSTSTVEEEQQLDARTPGCHVCAWITTDLAAARYPTDEERRAHAAAHSNTHSGAIPKSLEEQLRKCFPDYYDSASNVVDNDSADGRDPAQFPSSSSANFAYMNTVPDCRSTPLKHQKLLRTFGKNDEGAATYECRLCRETAATSEKAILSRANRLYHLYAKHLPGLFRCPVDDCVKGKSLKLTCAGAIAGHMQRFHPGDQRKAIDLRLEYDDQLCVLAQQCFGPD